MLTIKEVADLAGVSKATVSRVINNSGYVSPQTRLKIESIMKQYNYLPSASAVNLSRQETSTVGVVVPEIGNRFYADVVHGITEMADQMNLSLVFFSTSNSPEQEEKAIRTLRQQPGSGHHPGTFCGLYAFFHRTQHPFGTESPECSHYRCGPHV